MAETDQTVLTPRRGRPLRARLGQNWQALRAAHGRFAEAVRLKRAVPAAAEWLLDNFYIIEGQLRQVEHDLSRSYYRELPKLVAGPYAGYPRVYGLAFELIAHTDSHLNAEVLTRYLSAYQAVTPLTSGELWAVAIMLRLVLIENLRRLINQALLTQQRRAGADRWAAGLLTLTGRPPGPLVNSLGRVARAYTRADPVFLVHLLERLRDQSPAVSSIIHLLESWLAEEGASVEAAIRGEHQRQAANRVSTGNIVTSMRVLSSIDWPAFFEATSLVEQTLCSDPAAVYAEMSFAGRDHYRHVVEHLSRRIQKPEIETARRVLDFARNPADPADPRQAHIGYYLAGKGLEALQAELGYQPPLAERIYRFILRHPTPLYLGLIALFTLAVIGAELAYAAAAGIGLAGLMVLAGLLAAPALTLIVGLVHWLITLFLPPRLLPKIEFKSGLTAEHRTMVVAPVLISSESGVQRLLENLEVRFLANRDPYLHFALLGDFADAPDEQRPEDEQLIQLAIDGIRELNARYGGGREDRFYLFHRRRCWNAREQIWMGWERKRGKLLEFNRLLRGARDTTHSVQVGDLSILPAIRYVITLDADTELPHDSARQLIGAMAHPLNRPRLDLRTRCVVEGYGIIQPRLSVTATAGALTRFTRIYAEAAGLDPYSQAVSAVYPDLFDRGSYIGKAIYDVDAMLSALDGRFPENLLLSHDLLESAHVRAGSASDIQFLEDFPSGYDAFMQRHHRWVRGDWQIIEWLFPRVRDQSGQRVPNPIPLIERWKIFDNLQQSLVAPAIVCLLTLGWLLLPAPPWPTWQGRLAWTVIALLPLYLPHLITFVINSGLHPPGEPWRAFFRELGREAELNGARVFLSIAFLLYEAYINLEAIGRVMVRRAFRQRGLLEWTRAVVAERGQARTLADYMARMWPATAFALALLLLIAISAPASLLTALPILLLWAASPLIAYTLSQPAEPRERPLPDEARRELRLIARQIWRFYETFAGPEDHWLPPDNYQQEPNSLIAHRTSPTNIAFLLLSTVAAYDFGYLTAGELAERVKRVFDTLDQLDRYEGHFINWYNTLTLRPLYPEYISTVDSGNLAAGLLTLKQACLEIADPASAGLDDSQPLAAQRSLIGLSDTLSALQTAIIRLKTGAPHPPQSLDELARLAAAMQPIVGVTLLQGVAPAVVQDLAPALACLSPMARQTVELAEKLDLEIGPATPTEINFWTRALARQIESLSLTADPAELREDLLALANRAEAFVAAMNFTFLFDKERRIFVVGYNLSTKRLDPSYYDLLASEARLASFVTIALGQAPAEHWFRLDRPLGWTGGQLAALSWGGTMFEYLMPNLLMRDFEGSLLHLTERAAIQAQLEHAERLGVPWGISESGFYAFDYQLNYQYQLFGVPALGLKRGLGENIVIAPYATFLALPHVPNAAWSNLQRLAREGARDSYGYYEAIDYTPSRRPKGRRAGMVRSFMAHHQGMCLIALDNYLNDNVMPGRFHANPLVAAAELLLHERVPHHTPLTEPHPHTEPKARPLPTQTVGAAKSLGRRFVTPHTPAPRTHLLANGVYHVMLTNAGGGYSAYRPPAAGPAETRLVTRWRADGVRDPWGQFIYLRDVRGGQVWSATYQPTAGEPDDYEVVFAPDKAEFRRRDFGLETRLEITVSPQENVELRRLSLTNASPRLRLIEVTSYAEAALDTPRADLTHPAFSKLFIESETLPERAVLLFNRRPRAADQLPLWAFHSLACDSALAGEVDYETDRARFLGRGRTPRDPQSLRRPLSKTVGATLDPCLSLRGRVRLRPGQSVSFTFTTGVAESRTAALGLADKFSDTRAIENTFDLARVYTQIQLRHLGLTPDDAHLFQRLASRALYPDPALRAPAGLLAQNRRSQAGLWAYGISGDQPMVLVKIDEAGELGLVRQLLHAHEFWRLNNFSVDLVILNEYSTSYQDDLQTQLQGMIDASLSRPWLDKPGGVFLRKGDLIAPEDKVLLEAVACVVLNGDLGGLADQLAQSLRQSAVTPLENRRGVMRKLESPRHPAPWRDPRPDLMFFNGLGGFSADGREYVIVLEKEQTTPTPWINVLANPRFGCLVSESGLGYTWAENSQNNRLTPWSNDPVSDPAGEAIYLFDEQTGELWSPTPSPIREAAPYVIRHGAGYSLFEHTSHGLSQELLVCVPPDPAEPVKIMRLRLRNITPHTRHLAITGYAEWVLGETRAGPSFIITEIDFSTRALFARNTYHPDFSERLAFAACTLPASTSPHAQDRRMRFSVTSDRAEFLGRNGAPARPAAVFNGRLSGHVGAGFDSCAALQTRIKILPGETVEWVFLLGQGRNADHARALVERYRDPAQAQAVLESLAAHWNGLLETVQVHTPEPAFDLLLNRWLLRQALACRLWARSAFYQSGGAYGYRDQLQDVLALLFARPDLAREHILLAASRQFSEGDAQHWWHPTGGQGVRTRFSDDYLWLPFVTYHYMQATGDTELLNEPVAFLTAPPLTPDQPETYLAVTVPGETGTVYEHCRRALELALARGMGEHGLPFIGSGDWNDGLNQVGQAGKGESVWLGWFLFINLQQFAEIAAARGDTASAGRWQEQAGQLLGALDKAWDGAWYRRAYFDDGTPLGSEQNAECKIDSIAQTWAVIAADRADRRGLAKHPGAKRRGEDRAGLALDSVEKFLVREAEGLILLLAPPFNQTQPDPGYIQGYVPGIRENGGQYTHAALWVVWAYLLQGNGDRAAELFRLLNPIQHTLTPEAVERYKVEPYVVAADVYSHPQHLGRGGWTWYTGSASWMYRAGLEGILGLRRRGAAISIDPCLPRHWPGVEIHYRRGSAVYKIVIENPQRVNKGVVRVELDGQPLAGPTLELPDDGQTHEVRVVMG